MKKYKLLMLMLVPLFGVSQKIHSPAELFKIMTDSKTPYELKLLEKPISAKDYSDNLNGNNVYRVSTASGLATYKYNLSDKALPFYNKAEDFFKVSNADSALYYYQLTLKADSSLFQIITYIGQIYEKRKDFDNAILWYKKAISKNYIDYMAHWFLADAYMTKNDFDNAVDEIVIARILNRNNPRIKEAMVNILDKTKRNSIDWNFNPQVKITATEESEKITIAAEEKWIGYAVPKALWTFEPGYKESMGVPKDKYSTLEDRECLVSLLIGMENTKTKTKNDTQLTIMKAAAEKSLLNEYIMYEIVLPEKPFVAYQLPEETILNIKNYILTIRNTK